jgi:hypothetical protein
MLSARSLLCTKIKRMHKHFFYFLKLKNIAVLIGQCSGNQDESISTVIDRLSLAPR